MRRIHREMTATTIADATLESTQSVTNVCQEHVAVMAKRSQTGRPVSPDPVPHTDDTTAPHVPPASAASRCPATPRVRSTGSVTVADRLPHLDHRLLHFFASLGAGIGEFIRVFITTTLSYTPRTAMRSPPPTKAPPVPSLPPALRPQPSGVTLTYAIRVLRPSPSQPYHQQNQAR